MTSPKTSGVGTLVVLYNSKTTVNYQQFNYF